MEAVVKQALCNVKGADPVVFGKSVEDEFMFAHSLDRQLVAVFQRLLDVICVQCRELAGHLDVFTSEHQDVGVCPQDDAEIAMEAADFRNIEERQYPF